MAAQREDEPEESEDRRYQARKEEGRGGDAAHTAADLDAWYDDLGRNDDKEKNERGQHEGAADPAVHFRLRSYFVVIVEMIALIFAWSAFHCF
jgi:hypothetical protein